MKIIQQNEKQEDYHSDFFLKGNKFELIIGKNAPYNVKFKPIFGLKHEPTFYDITYYVIADYSDYFLWYWYKIC